MKKLIVCGLAMLALVTTSNATGAEKLHIEGSTTRSIVSIGRCT